jgi:hypothetical protein
VCVCGGSQSFVGGASRQTYGAIGQFRFRGLYRIKQGVRGSVISASALNGAYNAQFPALRRPIQVLRA